MFELDYSLDSEWGTLFMFNGFYVGKIDKFYQAESYGILKFNNMEYFDYYIGGFENNKLHGQGILIKTSLKLYEVQEFHYGKQTATHNNILTNLNLNCLISEFFKNYTLQTTNLKNRDCKLPKESILINMKKVEQINHSVYDHLCSKNDQDITSKEEKDVKRSFQISKNELIIKIEYFTYEGKNYLVIVSQVYIYIFNYLMTQLIEKITVGSSLYSEERKPDLVTCANIFNLNTRPNVLVVTSNNPDSKFNNEIKDIFIYELFSEKNEPIAMKKFEKKNFKVFTITNLLWMIFNHYF